MYCAIQAGEAENPEDRVGTNLNFSMMKKFKFLLGSAAFLVAVGGAFAGKITEPAPNFQQLYEEVDGECVESACTFIETSNLCTQTVYEERDPGSLECNTPITEDTWRP